jgi:hypothetical protein
MNVPRSVALLIVALALVMGAWRGSAMRGTATPPAGQDTPALAAVTARAVQAAQAFLAVLDEGQRSRARKDLTGESRSNWSNLPTGVRLQSGATERNGVKLGELTPAQQDAALALVASALSRDGFQKVMNIVNADQALEVSSAPSRASGSRIRFGRAEYYVAILGTPATEDLWMIQFGGHHLAINVTMAGANTVLTPSHTGTQPARFTLDGQTIRPLGDENDKAFALVNALDTSQQKQAILDYQVKDTVLGPGLDGRAIQPEGLRGSGFNESQRAMLVDLVGEWVGILNDEAARVKMSEVRKTLSETYFAWSGPTANGSGAYFRIQGPAVMIEYAPQGNIDHIHTFYRDPTNDYGALHTRR